MINLHYTPDEVSRLTLPLAMCLLSDKPASDRKIESASEFDKLMQEAAQREKEWFSK